MQKRCCLTIVTFMQYSHIISIHLFFFLICDLWNCLPCILFTNSHLYAWNFLHARKASCQPFPILVVLLTPVLLLLHRNLHLHPTVWLCFSFYDTDRYIWTISHILLHSKHYLELSGRGKYNVTNQVQTFCKHTSPELVKLLGLLIYKKKNITFYKLDLFLR